MSLREEYYDYVLKKASMDKAKTLLFEFVQDFTDRRGLRQEWEQIDEDIQEEILEKWLMLIHTVIDDIPSVNEAWINHEGVQFGFDDDLSCSQCGHDLDLSNSCHDKIQLNYCPHCGAKIIPNPLTGR